MKNHKFYCGDALEILKYLPSQSINCCITSPPYFGLRDYGIDGQIGLEATPEEYIQRLVDVFREVKRVLRNNGTLWLNIGDSYATGKPKDCTKPDLMWSNKQSRQAPKGYKHKDLIGIPWRIAFALQSDGWYLRADIIWNKPNAMPESVTDRPTKSHEYIFLLSKSERYYYDAEAIKEPAVNGDPSKPRGSIATMSHGANKLNAGRRSDSNNISDLLTKRNKRSVWTVATQRFDGAHFATFPPELIKPCILAGCPEDGIVLDPFGGSGTVSMMARKLGRNSIYIDINPEYRQLALLKTGYNEGSLFDQYEVV